MGTIYLIRHGQRFPLKSFSRFNSAFGDEPVLPGELTEQGRTRMQQLGATFKDVPIASAKFSTVRRCEESLTEFLKGAGCSVRPEGLGDRNFVNFEEYVQCCDVTTLADALKSSIRNRKALDELNEKYLPGLENGFLRDAAGGAIIDAMVVLEDRGIQRISPELEALDLDFTIAVAIGLQSHFAGPLCRAIFEGLENRDGVTVALVSDMHLLYVLQRIAPLLVLKRPPVGSVLKLTLSEGSVLLQYQNQEVKIPLTDFRRRIELDIPISHF